MLFSTGAAETAGKWRRYMLIRTLMSLATGALVWAFAYARRVAACGRMGRDCLRPQLHSLHRAVHRHRFSDLVRVGAVRIMARGVGGIRLPQHHPVRHWQLHRASCLRQRARDLSIRCAFLGVCLDILVGSVRRLHWCPDHDRPAYFLRAASLQPWLADLLGAPNGKWSLTEARQLSSRIVASRESRCARERADGGVPPGSAAR